jgi:outer membrane protein
MMRNVGVFLIGWALGMALVPAAWGAEALKIGYVDMQKALNQCQAGREAKKLITGEVEKMQKTFGAKQKELEKIKEDLEKRGSVMNESVRVEKERDYQARLRDLQRMQRDFEEDLRRKDRELTDRVLRDLALIVRRLGEEKGYTLILERNQAAIVYISGVLDLTDEVIKVADQKGK